MVTMIPNVRTLKAEELWVLARLYRHAAGGALTPMYQEALVREAIPMSILEALERLSGELALIDHPTTGRSKRPVLTQWDLTAEGHVLAERRACHDLAECEEELTRSIASGVVSGKDLIRQMRLAVERARAELRRAGLLDAGGEDAEAESTDLTEDEGVGTISPSGANVKEVSDGKGKGGGSAAGRKAGSSGKGKGGAGGVGGRRIGPAKPGRSAGGPDDAGS